MTKEIRRIDFNDFAAELSLVFDDLAREHAQILVEREGRLYRVEATGETANAAGHDAVQVRRILGRTSGAMKAVDRHTLMRDIHSSRQQSSRGRPA